MVIIIKYKIIILGMNKYERSLISKLMDTQHFEIICFLTTNKDELGIIYNDKPVIYIDEINNIEFDKLIIGNKYYNQLYDSVINEYNIPKNKIESMLFFPKQILIHKYKGKSNEYDEIIDFLYENELEVFNYDFTKKYIEGPDVYFDKKILMYYTIINGKKLYLKRDYKTDFEAKNYLRSIFIEQDDLSPHKYLDDNFCVCNGDIVIDAGVAEGNFALEVIDKVSKIYLIECDIGWVEALQETFKDYKDKVEIIPKILSGKLNEKSVTLDDFVDSNINFIKMDIEGSEVEVLSNSKKLLLQDNCKSCCICSYHNQNDEKKISQILSKYNYKVTYSKGYMYYPYEINISNNTINYIMDDTTFLKSNLRRGIVRGEKI